MLTRTARAADTLVSFPAGAVATALVILMIAAPTNADERSGRSSSIVLTPDQKTVCIANQDSGTVSLWDWSGDQTVREVDVGSEPRTLAVSPAGGLLYVTTQRHQELAVVDLTAAR